MSQIQSAFYFYFALYFRERISQLMSFVTASFILSLSSFPGSLFQQAVENILFHCFHFPALSSRPSLPLHSSACLCADPVCWREGRAVQSGGRGNGRRSGDGKGGGESETPNFLEKETFMRSFFQPLAGRVLPTACSDFLELERLQYAFSYSDWRRCKLHLRCLCCVAVTHRGMNFDILRLPAQIGPLLLCLRCSLRSLPSQLCLVFLRRPCISCTVLHRVLSGSSAGIQPSFPSAALARQHHD